MRDLNTIIIHCSATYPDMDIGVEEIRHWHVNGNGWSDIGYHFVIRRDGSIELGRPIEAAGAHAKGHNADSIGICMVGGKARDGKQAANFTAAQWATLSDLVGIQQQKHDIETVIGHNEVSDKACPAFDVQAWLAA